MAERLSGKDLVCVNYGFDAMYVVSGLNNFELCLSCMVVHDILMICQFWSKKS